MVMGNNGLVNANGTTGTAVGRGDDALGAPVDVRSGNSNRIDDGIGNNVIANADAVVAYNNEGNNASGYCRKQ